MTTDHTPPTDRLDDLRAEYANTGMVTSDGAVWLFAQIVVLREQVQRLSAPPADAPLHSPADRAALRDRIAEALDERYCRFDFDAAEFADAVLAVLPPPVSRADVYRELADQQEQIATTDVIRRRRSIATARRLFAVELRRMADEAQPGTEPAKEA